MILIINKFINMSITNFPDRWQDTKLNSIALLRVQQNLIWAQITRYGQQIINQTLKILFINSLRTNWMYKGSNGQVVYLEDIECVVDPVKGKGGIYIGNLEASQNIQTLKKYSIQGILTSAKGVILDHPKSAIPHQLYIPAEDRDEFDLSRYFDQAAEWIHNRLQETNILVHCLAGVSRSVSLVIAYLLKHKGMSFDDSFYMLKSRRKIIHPNEGFKKQLRDYERKNRTTSSLSPERLRNLQIQPSRSRYLNVSPTKNYEQTRTSYARQTFSPTKKYQYRYYMQQNAKPYGRQSLVGNLGSQHYPYYRKTSTDHKMDEIDRKIEQRRNNLNLSGRTKAFSQYNATNNLSIPQDHTLSVSSGKGISRQTMNDDIDNRIAQIRRKYQDYTESTKEYPLRKTSNLSTMISEPSTLSQKLKSIRERDFSRFPIGVYSNQNINPQFGSGLEQLRAKKTSSNPQGSAFGRSYLGRGYNYQYDKAQDYSRNRHQSSFHMRKTLSYQNY